MVTLRDLWDRAPAHKRQLEWRLFDQDGKKICDNYTGPGSGTYDRCTAIDIRDVLANGNRHIKVIINIKSEDNEEEYVRETSFLMNCRIGEREAAVKNEPWAWFQITGRGAANELDKLRALLSQHGYEIEKFESSERNIPIMRN